MHRVLAVLVLLALPAQAAEFTLVSQHKSEFRPVPLLHLDGPIVEGDVDQLRTLFDANIACGFEQLPPEGGNCALITLASPGGNYIEGLLLAQFMRENRIATLIEPDTECYSACAFAFLGGTGYSTQDGIGEYVDRMVAPGGILGFHAPYFAPDALDGLVAEYGLDEVLGASRDDISTMIGELVNWNVDENVLSYIVSMGPDQTYDITTGEDYFLTRTALPPELVLDDTRTNVADAVYNACIYLLAAHERQFPSAQINRISETTMGEIGVDTAGEAITGYRLGPDNPLGLTFCGLPSAQIAGNGDADIALYTGAGIKGDIRPMLTFFNRPAGWSSLNAGGRASRSIFTRGAMTTMFLNPTAEVTSDLFF